MIQFTQEEFDVAKTTGEALYKTFVSVYCPYFKERVSFNSKGLEHLRLKSRNKARLPADQFMRFKLIKLAPLILVSSGTLQGIWQTNKFEPKRMHSRTENVLSLVNYYEFTAVIKRDRVKIIVKQVDNGEMYFWSLIPFWGMNTEYMERILHDGDLENE
ncbi:MAG: hypothetical protein WCP09_01215 [Candidatus Taylorbacteria bacterium]